MGLGGYPGVTLAQAREAARTARLKLREGVDPIAEARGARSRLHAEKSRDMTFRQATEGYIEAHEASWRSDKHGQQWRNTLGTYAFPIVGDMLVRHIELSHVLKILEPIWRTKIETASRLRGRIESVLDWAAVRGARDGENPARWRGHLDKLLPAPAKLARVKHHKALPAEEIGGFMAKLRAQLGMGARALEFAILTGARSGEVRGARWEEIDLKQAVWTIPAERMKAGREHRVPLSEPALAVLKAVRDGNGSALLFPAPKGGELSDMTLSAVLKRMEVDAVPHGFRSTLRDWVAESTTYHESLAEAALAHVRGDKTVQAYVRGDLFEKRRQMMNEWASFCGQASSPESRGNRKRAPRK